MYLEPRDRPALASCVPEMFASDFLQASLH